MIVDKVAVVIAIADQGDKNRRCTCRGGEVIHVGSEQEQESRVEPEWVCDSVVRKLKLYRLTVSFVRLCNDDGYSKPFDIPVLRCPLSRGRFHKGGGGFQPFIWGPPKTARIGNLTLHNTTRMAITRSCCSQAAIPSIPSSRTSSRLLIMPCNFGFPY